MVTVLPAAYSKTLSTIDSRHCCVPICVSDGRKKSDAHLSFHHFPLEKKLRKNWILMIRRDPVPYSSFSNIIEFRVNIASMDDTKKSIVAILAYLEEQNKVGGLDKEQAESLGAAIQSLEKAYGVSACDLHLVVPQAAHEQTEVSFFLHSPQTPYSGPCRSTTPEVSPGDREDAERHKNEGNELMKAGKYPEAVESYTKAIQKDGRNAVYFCNRILVNVVSRVCMGMFVYYVYTRAAAYGPLRENIKVIEDCKAALAIDPAYSKAFGRMGMAYTALGKHESAVACHRKAVELEPHSENYRKNLEIAEQKSSMSASKDPGSKGSGGGMQDMWSKMHNPQYFVKLTEMLRDPRADQIILGFMSKDQKSAISSLLDVGHLLLDHFWGPDTNVPEPPEMLQQQLAVVHKQPEAQGYTPTTSDSDDQNDDPMNDKE